MAPRRNLVLRPRQGIESRADEQSVARLVPLNTERSDLVFENSVEISVAAPSAHSSPDPTPTPCCVHHEALPSSCQDSSGISETAHNSAHSSPDSTFTLCRVRQGASVMMLENSAEISETAPSAHSHPDPSYTPCSVHQQALPILHERDTLAATINIWSRNNDGELSAHLDKPTNDILDSILNGHLPPSPITKVKLQLVVNLAGEHRFEINLDFTQWHDFARAVRLERVAPMEDTFGDIFLPDIHAATGNMFEEVGPLDGKPNDCERVLAVAEEAVEDVFFRKSYWLDSTHAEMLEGLAHKD